MLSRKADYGVRAIVDIARQPASARVIVADIAKRQKIPAFYLAKIMPRLARAGIVRTTLGAAGGIALGISPDQISLLQIIEAIDGPLALNQCSVNPTDCEHHATCSALDVWCRAQAQLNRTLAETRVSDLAARPCA